jgi:hypothetical protein
VKLFHGSNQNFLAVDLSASNVANIYTAEMALKQLRHFKVNDQLSFHTEKALSGLMLLRKHEYGK